MHVSLSILFNYALFTSFIDENVGKRIRRSCGILSFQLHAASKFTNSRLFDEVEGRAWHRRQTNG